MGRRNGRECARLPHCTFKATKQAGFVFALQFVLPNSEYMPAGFSQCAVDCQIPLPIGCDFVAPECAITFGFGVAARATVPEAAVNKYNQPQFQKDKIRFSEKPMAASPTGDARIFQQLDKSQFCGLVPVRTNSGHERRPFHFSKNIRHEISTDLITIDSKLKIRFSKAIMPSPKVVGSPTKSLFLDALTSDIELADAVSDLVDNVVDAARRHRSDGQYEGLEVRISFDKSHFQIQDNCGGIDLETAEKVLFSLGRPRFYKPTPGQIGRFGIGMKRDLFMMGNQIVVESSSSAGKSQFRIDIDLEEWAKRKDWDFTFTEYKKRVKVPVGKAGTHITVKNLRPSVSNEFSLPTFTETLVAILQKKQKQALQHHLSIFVGKTRLTSKPYKLKYLAGHIEPAFFGRDYNGTAPLLSVKLIAGIEDSKSVEAGWYVSCNGRFVLVADQSPKTGWGEEGKIPKMHHQFARFRGYVFFECDDPARLPWNSTKTGLNTDSNIYRDVKCLMISATRPIIDFLNKLDAEKDSDERPLEKAVAQSEARPVTTLFNKTLKLNSNFSYKGLEGEFDPSQPIRIAYVKPLGEVQKIRKKLGVDGNREVGLGTFEYYFNHELRTKRT